MPTMTESMFQIGAQGIDAAAIVADIKAAVARKTADGVYSDMRVARAEKTNLAALSDSQFDQYYLDCLWNAVFVDINDFTIRERRSMFPRILVGLKTLIWKMLKFYTYRLWSQQNEVNGLLLSAVEATDSKYREKIEELEARIAKLEGKEPR